MDRKRIALGLFILGAVGLVGSLISVSVAVAPIQYLIMVALMAPYLYIQFQEGQQST